MTDDAIVYMSVKEFRELGFLQEVNRLFLHPRGLALEVKLNEDGTEELSGIWDYRNDPEGMAFSAGTIDPHKAERVEAEFRKHEAARIRMFGAVIQQS